MQKSACLKRSGATERNSTYVINLHILYICDVLKLICSISNFLINNFKVLKSNDKKSKCQQSSDVFGDI